MWTKRIGISLENNYDLRVEEVVRLVYEIGFDAISPVWSDRLHLIVQEARKYNLAVQSLHAPISGTADMWNEGVKEPLLLNQLLNALEDCKKFGIPILVVHTWQGFGVLPEPTERGLFNFKIIVDRARAYGIKIAFENMEGGKHLDALMNYFKNDETVGFCWDSGHENCYNRLDLLSKYGDRLIMTHLSDNFGVRQTDGSIFWTDDLHLVPFDGAEDWEYNAERLRRAKPCEFINFEIKKRSKTGGAEHARYEKMTLEEYFSYAYDKACKFLDLLIKN